MASCVTSSRDYRVFLFFLRNRFNFLCHVSVDKVMKILICISPQINSVWKGWNICWILRTYHFSPSSYGPVGDTVLWWRHGIKYFPHYCHFVRRITGPLISGFSLQRSSNAELWCFFDEQMVEQTVESSVIWDAVTLTWRHCNAI